MSMGTTVWDSKYPTHDMSMGTTVWDSQYPTHDICQWALLCGIVNIPHMTYAK
jgi:hypothetical protein